MKRLLIITIPLGLIFVLVGYFIYARYSSAGQPQSNTAIQSQQTEIQTVNALGRIEPNGRVIRLTAPAGLQGAIVTKLLVKEGEEIAEGEIVALLDGYEQQLAVVNEAQTRVTVARTRLEQVLAGAKSGDLNAKTAETRRLEAELFRARKELERAENRASAGIPLPEYAAIGRVERELENARTEFGRAQRLYEAGIVSRSEFDSRRLAVETYEKDLERNRAALQTVIRERRTEVETLARDIERSKGEYSSLAEVRPTDVSNAEAEVENAKAAVARELANLELRRVKSYAAGKVLKIHARPGESIGNDGILELGDTNTMVAVAEVFEADIAKIKTEKRAEITVRTTGEKFGGEVVQIDPIIKKRDILDSDPVADVDARVVEVRVRLDADASRKLADLTNLRVDVKLFVS